MPINENITKGAPAMPTGFNPSHTIELLTNYLPNATTENYSEWRRVKIIPFAQPSNPRGNGGDAA